MRSAVRFQLEQLSLPVEPKAKAAETGISDDSMTRHDEQQPIFRASLADRTKRAGVVELRGEFAISQHGSTRDRPHPLTDLLHERSAGVFYALVNTEARNQIVE